MNLLLPLGLLGFLSIAALIFIYIIKPNYQQKMVSSTYVWKLSLKYKKKRISTNRLRNILIFLCQFLILSSFALLLARPVIPYESTAPKNEKVAILDASASMLVAGGGKTRFERAVEQIGELAETTLTNDDSALSVIVAGEEPYVLIPRMRAADLPEIRQRLDSLITPGLQCSYGSADMEKAALLTEDVLRQNSETEVLLYTATEYVDKGSFHVVNVSNDDDWNVAVLNCASVLEENNCYSFSVDVGCFGRAKSVTVYAEIAGANGQAEPLKVSKTEYFNELEPQKNIVFSTADFGGMPLVSYETAFVYVDENDPFEKDNTFNLYGGTKQTIRIQYASTLTNNFFGGVLRTLRETKKDYWNIELKELTNGEKPVNEGFDLYIYEHLVPENMPTDGVVLLVAPDADVPDSGLRFGEIVKVNSTSTLASGAEHPLTENLNPDRITIAEYRRLISADGFEELMYYNSDPIMLVKEQENAKVVLLTLNLNKSSLAIMVDFPMMMYNLFSYFIPPTLTQNTFEVGSTVTMNARGEGLTVTGTAVPDGKLEFETLPGTLEVMEPGDYTVTQQNMRGEYVVEQFFVHIPAHESNITKTVDSLPQIYSETTTIADNQDLLIWFAAAALVLLFAEWWLHSRENL